MTFAIDERAEALLERFLAERAPEVAFYSEDRGMVSPRGEPAWVLVVDPIDGTRPAMAGLESAASRSRRRRSASEPRMGDVEAACIVEIKSGAVFIAERGEPARSRARGCPPNTDLARMFWTSGSAGDPRGRRPRCWAS